MAIAAVERNGLLEGLEPLPRLVLLIAPAGYGKTTLARAILLRSRSTAVCDLAHVASPTDVVRSVVEAIVAGDNEKRRLAVADQFIALADNEPIWIRFGQRFLRELSEPRLLCFENGETIAESKALCRTIEALLCYASEALSVIACSRVPLDLKLGRFAGPDVTRIIGADDLRFDRTEMLKVFAGTSLNQATLERIESFTTGWPILVMMLYQLAKRGRLQNYLLGKRDDSNLYGYLAGEVYASLHDEQRVLLEAIAAIPGATERDLEVLFAGYARTLRELEQETPFVSRTPTRTIEVHPAMREMLASLRDPKAVLERLFEALARDDGGLRAAQIALHLGRPRDAARTLLALEGYLEKNVSPEYNAVLSAIPGEILAEFPELWSVGTLGRAFTRHPRIWIDEGKRVFASCVCSTSDTVRGSIAMSLSNEYLGRGRWDDFEAFAKRLVSDASDSFRPLAELIAGFWTLVADAYRGRAIDTSLINTRFATFMEDRVTRALTEYDLIARNYRLRGDRVKARAALNRAVDMAMATDVPLIQALVVMDVAFDAWFWGEDELFTRYLEILESLLVPTIERGFSLFVLCARGHGDRAIGDVEKLKTRAYAFTIAASLEPEHCRRLSFLREAVVAADHADQPFAQIVSRAALALTLEGLARQEVFDEAESIANLTCSNALREAVRQARNGDAGETMLASVAARFATSKAKSASITAVVDLVTGTVMIDGRDLRFSEREAQLVTLLALRGTVHSDEIADVLWPDSEGDRAAASVKVYVSRLRRLADNREFIVHQPHGYRLGTPARVIHGPVLAWRFARWTWMRIPSGDQENALSAR